MIRREVRVKVTFIEELLATGAANPDIHRAYIASKSPNACSIEEEVAAVGVDSVVENAMTVFPKHADGRPFVWDYQVRGFFKEAGKAMKASAGTHSAELKAYKQAVDNRIFVTPRQIDIDMCGGMIDNCQRPLRGSTPQGERIALANSETVPEGSTIEFTIIMTNPTEWKYVKEWLDYGFFKGLGQWRNSGKGRFTYEILSDETLGEDVKGDVPDGEPKRRGRPKKNSETAESDG